MSEDRNNSYKFDGKVVDILGTKSGVSVTGEWMVQQVIIEDSEVHKKYFFEIFGREKCEKFDLHVGDEGSFFFNIYCSTFNGKYYTNLRIWKVNKLHKDNPVSYKGTQEIVKDEPKESETITDVNQLPF